MIIRKSASIIIRSLLAGHISARSAVRMSAYAILADLAAREPAARGHALTFKMHIGAMRGEFRRSVERRRAEKLVREYRRAYPAIAAMWRGHKQVPTC